MPEFWATWVELIGGAIADDHDMTIKHLDSISASIPTYVVRFEDLITDPAPVVKEMFRFLLDVPSIEGTVLEKRINEKCAPKNAPKALYKLKQGSQQGTQGTEFNKNSHMYSVKRIARLKEQLKDYLLYFGYTNNPTVDTDTAFFEYEYDEFDENDLAYFRGFDASNKRVLSEIGTASDGPKPEYEFNNGGFMKLNLLTAPMPFT